MECTHLEQICHDQIVRLIEVYAPKYLERHCEVTGCCQRLLVYSIDDQLKWKHMGVRYCELG